MFKDYTKAEMRTIGANDIISASASVSSRFYNPAFPEHWDVDFSGVVAGFL